MSRGLVDKKWDARAMALALQARSWVKGPDLGVGACVISPDFRRFSLGYSGLPRGLNDTTDRITLPEYKDYHMVHAELNAILNAQCSLAGWTIYATTCPCSHCASAIIQAGISRVVSPEPLRGNRWYRHHLEGRDALREAGLTVDTIDLDGLE